MASQSFEDRKAEFNKTIGEMHDISDYFNNWNLKSWYSEISDLWEEIHVLESILEDAVKSGGPDCQELEEKLVSMEYEHNKLETEYAAYIWEHHPDEAEKFRDLYNIALHIHDDVKRLFNIDLGRIYGWILEM